MKWNVHAYAPCALISAALFFGGCATPSSMETRIDPEVRRSSALGRTAYENGSLESAARMYAAALNLARASRNYPGIADTAYNLAVCRVQLGQPDAARVLLSEALRAAEKVGLPTDELLLMDVKAALLAGDSAGAEARLDDISKNQGVRDAVRAEALALRGARALDAGDRVAAEVALMEMKKNMRHGGDGVTHAFQAGLEARLAAAGQSAVAARLYDAQAEHWRKAGFPDDMARALLAAATQYELSGDDKTAWDRAYDAARSFMARNQRDAAGTAARKAADLAVRLSNNVYQQLSSTLMKEMP